MTRKLGDGMRQEDGRKLVRYGSPGERDGGWLEPSRHSSARLAAGGRRWDEGVGVPHSVRYLHDTFDVTALAWRILAVVFWHLYGKPDVLSWRRYDGWVYWRRYGGNVIGDRKGDRSGDRNSDRNSDRNGGSGGCR